MPEAVLVEPLVVPVVPDVEEDPVVAAALWMVMSASTLPVVFVLRKAPAMGVTATLVLDVGVALVPAAGVAEVAAPAVGELSAVAPVDAAPDALNGAIEPDHWFCVRTEL